VVRCPFDDVADLDGIAEGVLPEKGSQEIDIDIYHNPEGHHQQENQQKEKLDADRIGYPKDLHDEFRVSHDG
jgi:hypothetical protein